MKSIVFFLVLVYSTVAAYAQTNFPNDPYYSSKGSWGQEYDDLWGLKKIQAESAWSISQGEGIVVAVIDSGLDYKHPDLKGNIYKNRFEIPNNHKDDDLNGYLDDYYGWNFIEGDNEVMDNQGRGTYIAGIIAARGDNYIGVIGVAPKAKIMPLKALDAKGQGLVSVIANCIKYAADNGAKVIHNSFYTEKSRLITEALEYAHKKGAVVVGAGSESTISVATVDYAGRQYREEDYRRGQKSVYSPGVDILSTVPFAKYTGGLYADTGRPAAYAHVCGIAALILAKNPRLNPDEVGLIIHDSAGSVVNAYEAVKFASEAYRISLEAVSLGERNPVIRGTVNLADLKKYELYAAPIDKPEEAILIASSTRPIEDGILGNINLQAGQYLVTLKVFTNQGQEIIRSLIAR